jgi:hypothetical protein
VAKTLAEMRPFHAFTVPPPTIEAIRTMSFDAVPWESYLRSASGEQAKARHDMILLDASKLAATKINTSFSLFSPLGEWSQTTSRFGGLFLGPERIEAGDVLRVQRRPLPMSATPTAAAANSDEPSNVLLGVREILTNSNNPDVVYVRGTEYDMVTVTSDAQMASLAIVPLDNLPAALREEISWREHIRQQAAAAGKPTTSRKVVVLLQADAVHREPTIRGRWYPTNRLMPVTRPDAFQAAVQQGHVDDSGTYLNSRMDSLAQHYMGRKVTRLATAGTAIPQGRVFAFEPQVSEVTA